MATDVKLDQGGDGSFLVLEGRVVKAAASDFMLDSPERHKGSNPHRRALVHNQSDGLTINFNGDYTGGVRLVGVTEIIPQQQPGQPDVTLVVRGGISYEAEVLTGASGQGSTEGETHTITVNVDEVLSSLQSQIVELRARVAALEARPHP